MEVYKTVVEINPEFMWTYFLKNRISYDLRKDDKVFLPTAKFARYGINSLLFRGSLLWSLKNGLLSVLAWVKLVACLCMWRTSAGGVLAWVTGVAC